MGWTGQTQPKWPRSLSAAYRTLLEFLPVSVLQDTQATAAFAQVGHVDVLESTLEWNVVPVPPSLTFPFPSACFSQRLSQRWISVPIAMVAAHPMPTVPRWLLDNAHVPAGMATRAMGSCARVRGPKTDTGRGGHLSDLSQAKKD